MTNAPTSSNNGPHAGEGRYPRKGNPLVEVPPLRYEPQSQTAWVYILANQPNGILYVGITKDLPRRISEHKQGLVEGFTQKYGCKTLVYFEGYRLVIEAIEREKNIKNWPRRWKIRRILQTNPEWRDLTPELA